MATARGSYDPTNSIDGMFNGSVTRIAYALRDPNNYGGGTTKTVLAECAKKFHDALDDCEIQLLNAKWYLEHQLSTNRMRREAKAREMGTAAKRKHDEIKDSNEASSQEQATTKKLKVDDTAELNMPKEQAIPNPPAPEPTTEQSNTTKDAKSPVPQPKQNPDEDEKTKNNQPAQATQPVQPTPQPIVSNKELPEAPTKDPPPPDDFAKPTPQATPTNTNDEFNFESMFGDTAGADENKEFDFTTGDAFDPDLGSGDQDPTSLDTFLPGLESYANQTDENIPTIANDNSNVNANNNSNNITSSNNNTGDNINVSNTQDTNNLPSLDNDFNLPDLGDGPNIFDDLFDEDGLGGLDGGGSFEDNIDLTDSALLDFDLEGF